MPATPTTLPAEEKKAPDVPGMPTAEEKKADGRIRPWEEIAVPEIGKHQGQKLDVDPFTAGVENEFHNQSL